MIYPRWGYPQQIWTRSALLPQICYLRARLEFPANVQADLISFGFTQAQIDQISLAVSQRGLSNNGLTTKLDQFRATQDELADTRSGMLVLAVQLLGYQIAIRQANGITPTAITDADMQELAQDELRLLVHAAHLNAMWGSDPSTEVGEGDWWFIEHYAGRASERLQALTIEFAKPWTGGGTVCAPSNENAGSERPYRGCGVCQG